VLAAAVAITAVLKNREADWVKRRTQSVKVPGP
jgi:hypothetical protein